MDIRLNDDWFSPLPEEEKNSEFIALEGKTFIQEAWERFSKNKMAVVGLIILILMAVFAIVGPLLSPYEYDAQDTSNAYAAFSSQHILGTDKFGRDVFVRLCYGARISLSIGFGAA